MNCFVCGHKMKYYFSKKFDDLPDKILTDNFVKCPNCGIVVDESYYNYDAQLINELNSLHDNYQGTNENISDPKWIKRLNTQAQFIADLFRLGIFPHGMSLVDYGCGDGKLSQYVEKKCITGDKILNYDKYMKHEGYLSDKQMVKKSLSGIITCSVFEHLIGAEAVDEILSYLDDNGVFCLHTLICEEVPNDPSWFYLLPNHCTLWTNKAMSIIFNKYKFIGCAYHVDAQMWLFFRNKDHFDLLNNKKDQISGELILSNNFVDYWKIKPYR